MEFNYLKYSILLIVLVLGGVVFFGRKNIYGAWDPFYLTVAGLSFNAANIIYFGANNIYNLVYGVIGFCVFFLAARFGAGRSLSGRKLTLFSGFGLCSQPSRSLMRYLLIVGMVLQIVYYSFLFRSVGFGLFTGDVSPDVKTMIFFDGFGVFKYIIWASNYILLPLFVYMLVFKIDRPAVMLCVLVYITLNVLFITGKAGLLLKIFEVGIVAIYLWRRYRIRFFSRSLFFVLAVVFTLPAVVVITFYATDKGVSPVAFFVMRLIDTGGGSYGYFVLEGNQVFDGVTFFDRLRYYFDTILSVSRIKEWADPNRTALVTQFITGDYQRGYGQNPYLFVDGHFLFGYIGGMIYISLIGFVFGFSRVATGLNFLAYYVCSKLVLNLIVDPDMFQAAIVSIIILLPFLGFYLAIYNSGNKQKPHVKAD